MAQRLARADEWREADWMRAALFWLNQCLDPAGGLLDRATRLAQLETTWAERVEPPGLRKCMELAGRCGKLLADQVQLLGEQSVADEAELTALVNQQLQARYNDD